MDRIEKEFKKLLNNRNALLGILVVVGFLLYKCKNKNKGFNFNIFKKESSKTEEKMRKNNNSSSEKSLTSSSKNNHLVENMKSSSQQKKKVTLYYADGCGHCDAFKPVWNEFKDYCNKNTNNIKVEDCNCALESEVEKCSTAGITGVPTVLVENNSSVQEYTGSRDLNTLITFVESC